MNRLSACLITLNEERNLPRALRSLEGVADEIIVVDCGSQDRTQEIARAYKAKAIIREWRLRAAKKLRGCLGERRLDFVFGRGRRTQPRTSTVSSGMETAGAGISGLRSRAPGVVPGRLDQTLGMVPGLPAAPLPA